MGEEGQHCRGEGQGGRVEWEMLCYIPDLICSRKGGSEWRRKNTRTADRAEVDGGYTSSVRSLL